MLLSIQPTYSLCIVILFLLERVEAQESSYLLLLLVPARAEL